MRTVAHLIDYYIADNLAFRGLSRQRAQQLDRLRRALGHIPLDRFGYTDVRNYCRQRYAKDKVQPSTVLHDFAALQALFQQQRENIREAHNIDLDAQCAAFKRAKPGLYRDGVIANTNQRDRRISPYEEAAICAAADRFTHSGAVPLSTVVPFAISTAMRLGEITRITWADLDGNFITIRDRKHPTQKKGNDQRIPLFPKAQAALLKQRHLAPGQRIFPYYAPTVSQRFRRTATSLQFANLHFHDLRHEGISRMFEADLKIQEVAIVSGHKSWANLRRYTHIKPEKVLEKATAMAQETTAVL